MKFISWIVNQIFPKKIPLVVICGGTGTGKSKLAIEIAQYFKGEIINTDALQIYKGMDIITNKISKEESKGVKHHLLGYVNVETLNYTVYDFQKAALDKIHEIRNSNKMPVLVGGTNYYIESILWQRTFDTNGDFSKDVEISLEHFNNKELYEYLRFLDIQSASLLHPNARRKVIRAVEVALNSERSRNVNAHVNTRRFPLNETVFIWVDTTNINLFPRLEKRVDSMIDRGLLSELMKLHSLFLKLSPNKTYTKGIFQAIGLKEFRDYFECLNNECNNSQEVLAQCVKKLKLSNRQYVKRQNSWIKNRFLTYTGEERNIPLFRVDSTDVSQWRESVFERSVDIIEAIMASTCEKTYSDFIAKLNISPEPLSPPKTVTPCYKTCEACDNRIFVSQETWIAHIEGKRHARQSKRFRKMQCAAIKLQQ